jgi:hypothetical protein
MDMSKKPQVQYGFLMRFLQYMSLQNHVNSSRLVSRGHGIPYIIDSIYLRSTEIFLTIFLRAISRYQDDITAELTPGVIFI